MGRDNDIKRSNKKTVIAIYFIKFWATGIAYFLAFNTFIPNVDQLDRLVALWLILALVYEYVINNLILYLSTSWYDTSQFIIFKAKKKTSYKSLALTILYTFIILSMTVLGLYLWERLYQVIKIPTPGMLLFGTPTFGIDSISFSLVLLINETILWLIKRLIIKAKRGEKSEKNKLEENL